MTFTETKALIKTMIANSDIELKQSIHNMLRENSRRVLKPTALTNIVPVLSFQKSDNGHLSFEVQDVENYTTALINLERRKQAFKAGARK